MESAGCSADEGSALTASYAETAKLYSTSTGVLAIVLGANDDVDSAVLSADGV